jgi:hypothetical protein
VTATLTGRTRYRVERRWFRAPLVVLQVEKRGWVTTHLFGHHNDSKAQVFWEDAKPEDVMKEPSQ